MLLLLIKLKWGKKTLWSVLYSENTKKYILTEYAEAIYGTINLRSLRI